MARILKGAPVATAMTEDLTTRCNVLKERGLAPSLAVIRVGEKPSDLSYEASAVKRCEKIGISVKKIVLSSNVSEKELIDTINSINVDNEIQGCLMFRPLDNKQLEMKAIEALDPIKDIDCMTPMSLMKVFAGVKETFAPCTPRACLKILDYYGYDLTGANVAVIGRSNVVGKPLSMLLQARNATVTMCHTKTRDLPGICKRADIIVSAAGKANMISLDHVREGQVIIDVGINVDATGKLCGDVDFEAAEPIVDAITPVPGGVGAVTTSVLAEHLIAVTERKAKLI